MTNKMTGYELYKLTECLEWSSCDHIQCKARREIEQLRSAMERIAFMIGAGDTMQDATINGLDNCIIEARLALNLDVSNLTIGK